MRHRPQPIYADPGTEPKLPKKIFAHASPTSIGGRSLFEMDDLTAETALAAAAPHDVMRDAAAALEEAGFDILHVWPTTISFAGSPKLFAREFNCKLKAKERPVSRDRSRPDKATFIDCKRTDQSGLIDTTGTRYAGLIEGIAVDEPRFVSQESIAPKTDYWHLNVPGDVSGGCGAARAHRIGLTGQGVRVVMVDTGFEDHPYFAARGYNIRPVEAGPGATAPDKDECGHGTAQAANLLAVAPGVELTMVKMHASNSVAAFNHAVSLSPDVISLSWGGDLAAEPLSAPDKALAAAVAYAVKHGITVVCAAGNGVFGFPAQHPDVIAAGGAYMEPDRRLRASDFSSGFESKVYPGRNVPDVCGLVGMQPTAAYIMLPVPSGSELDRYCSLAGDGTKGGDGWAALSGTSAAAAQIAGVCALVLEANPSLTPAELRDILRRTARDVTEGRGGDATLGRPGMGHPAEVGEDLATGSGLVDAYKAALVAKVNGYGDHYSPFYSIRVGGPRPMPEQPPQAERPSTPSPASPQPAQPAQPVTMFSGTGAAQPPNAWPTSQGMTRMERDLLIKLIIDADLD
ncbi:S8 family serine peptidase [Actinomadura barringtoniae]|uniref:S8 family serine peptidase n=1 Tax=Actinomadura barringtoniae TaxID=1427535 RepID=A0A939PJ35_9ACTN|nr:S8 family serine peptidase [Actinomadura barringtoniae]MBO2450124.1 S8 family serine peptidase [Actinomadura barringtoniae]